MLLDRWFRAVFTVLSLAAVTLAVASCATGRSAAPTTWAPASLHSTASGSPPAGGRDGDVVSGQAGLPTTPSATMADVERAAAPAEGAPVELTVPAGGALELDVESAVLLALENNKELRVERSNPPIHKTFEEEERSAFDPVLSGSVSGERVQQFPPAASGAVRGRTDSVGGTVSLDQFLPTGTTLALGASADRTESSTGAPLTTTRLGLSVTQALLRGSGTDVNLASLRQARLDTLSSEYALRGFAEALMAQVEETYWNCALALRQIEIFTESLKLAEQQLQETEERIRIGKLPEIELAATQAEVALRREGLINARSALATTRLRLLRLLNPPGGNLWGREVTLREQPTVPEAEPDAVEAHVQLALRMRPDLNQARVSLQRGDLDVVKTKNGLLPQMDLFITLGKSGYADSFGDSVADLTGDSYDALLGVDLEYPLDNRAARARYGRAVRGRDQADEAVQNLAQLVELDVRSAYIEVSRAREQVAATAATRTLQEETLRAETEKFRVGKSTTFLVARAQRDLLASQIGEIEAVVNYRTALVELYRLEGSLLARRGITTPGDRAEQSKNPAR